MQARGLKWGSGEAQVLADGDFDLDGTTKAWAAKGKATLQRANQGAQLDFDAQGNEAKMRVQALTARMDSGKLEATGELAWSPALAYDFDASLAGFDPGYFAPDWPGAVSGRVQVAGGRAKDGGSDTHLVLSQMGGALRTRPLSGRADLRIHSPADARAASSYEGDAALRLGDSNVEAKGRIAQSLEVDARFAPLQLSDFLPDVTTAVELGSM